jgi:hypothetical protein
VIEAKMSGKREIENWGEGSQTSITNLGRFVIDPG